MDDYNVNEEVFEAEEYEGSKDYTTLIGVGVIAAGGALAYEGVKQGGKLAKRGWEKWVTPRIEAAREAKDKKAAEKAAKKAEAESTEAE